MKNIILFVLSMGVTLVSYSQDDWLSKALVKGMGDSGAQKKAKLDSIDFQFAISVNDNVGFIDIKNKGEGWSNALYAMKEKGDRTKGEIARDTLETAIGFYNLRFYKIAEESFGVAKKYMEDNELTAEISYLRCVSNLGLVALVQGKTIEAEQFIDFAMEASTKTLGDKSAAYAANLNSQAKLYQLTGKYNEAEKLFDESAAVVVKVFGENSLQNAIVLNNKAMLYQSLGRYPEAIELMKKAVAAQEAISKKKNSKSFDSRRFLTNLAYTYQLEGNMAEAEKTFLFIKDVYEKRNLIGQKGNPEYANLLNQLALLYMQMGKMDQVEPLLTKSAATYKKLFTEENASFAKVQNDLGNYYRIQGRFPEAEAALTKAVNIRKNTLGESHPDYVKSVENLGILQWKKGDLNAAKTTLKLSTDKSLEFINQYFPPMSEAEKTKYWDILQPRFQRYYNFAVEASATDPTILKEVFNYQIATKALLLNSTNKIKKSILASGDQSLISDYVSWVKQKETLARYYALSKEELNQQKIDLPALERQANATEKSLSQRSSDFSKAFTTEQITVDKVAGALADNEALVEVIRVRNFDKDFTADSKYVVMVLTKGNAQPAMVILDNGSQLETRYAKFYKNAIQQKIPDDYSYSQYWAKIEPLLAGKKTIFLSPDGVYNQLNVNTFKKTDGDFLVNKFDVITIGNSKDLLALKLKKKVLARKDAFMLGFPDYAGNAVALPGTKVELEAISKILTTSGFKVTQRTQKEASETNIKALKGPAMVHIATHGYFLADSDLAGGDALGIDAENAKNNPLLRSGLILAGVQSQNNNQSATELNSNDNGVLTAYEAMNLDLEGTDLIVLSACETGLGDVRAGEGVYGLQRAFMVAGANALIMSLWKVDDAATQQLMTNFYTNWSKTGDRQKAFKQAQIQLMSKYKDPYYWGAFVMMGM